MIHLTWRNFRSPEFGTNSQREVLWSYPNVLITQCIYRSKEASMPKPLATLGLVENRLATDTDTHRQTQDHRPITYTALA